MRLVVFATALAGVALLGGCGNFMNASGSAAARWERLEAARAAKANPPTALAANAKKVCKSITPIGSVMPKRVCSTDAEWAEFDAETGKTADSFNQLRRSGALAPATEGSQFQAE